MRCFNLSNLFLIVSCEVMQLAVILSNLYINCNSVQAEHFTGNNQLSRSECSNHQLENMYSLTNNLSTCCPKRPGLREPRVNFCSFWAILYDIIMTASCNLQFPKLFSSENTQVILRRQCHLCLEVYFLSFYLKKLLLDFQEILFSHCNHNKK